MLGHSLLRMRGSCICLWSSPGQDHPSLFTHACVHLTYSPATYPVRLQRAPPP